MHGKIKSQPFAVEMERLCVLLHEEGKKGSNRFLDALTVVSRKGRSEKITCQCRILERSHHVKVPPLCASSVHHVPGVVFMVEVQAVLAPMVCLPASERIDPHRHLRRDMPINAADSRKRLLEPLLFMITENASVEIGHDFFNLARA